MKRLTALLLSVLMLVALTGCDSSDYKKAVALMDSGDYSAAQELFEALGDYEDSADQVIECKYQRALAKLDDDNYIDAQDAFEALGDYKDSADQVIECKYQRALEMIDDGEYADAAELLTEVGAYKDSETLIGSLKPEMLRAYIEENGTHVDSVLASDGDGYELALSGDFTDGDLEFTVYIALTDEDEFAFGYAYYSESGIALFYELSYAEGEDSPTDTEACGGIKILGSVVEVASGTTNLANGQFTSGYFRQELTKATGAESTSYSYDDALALSSNVMRTSYTRLKTKLPVLLEETGLDMTIYDLGF